MKTALIGMSMLAVACIVCGPAFAVAGVPHSPITHDDVAHTSGCANFTAPASWVALGTPYGAPATASVAGSIPIFSLMPTLDNPVTSWPAAGSYDFCAAFDSAACALGALSSVSTDVLAYQALFFCSTDINGPAPAPGAPVPVTANGIPDGEYELGLLAAILNDTGNSHNAEVTAAFQANYNYFRVLVNTALSQVPIGGTPTDARGLIVSIAGPYLHTALTMLLAGFATEGDSTTLAALDTLLLQLAAIGITPPPGGVASVTTGFAGLLGPDGDADQDTYSNRAEYNYFKTQGAAATIAAELNPNLFPPATVPRVIIMGAGTAEVGSALELTAAALNCAAADYQWFKDGNPLAPETASSLIIPVLALTDAGSYVCRIHTVAKAPGDVIDSNPVVVNVVPAGSLPIAGGLGLALLAGACALGGVGSIRRRK